MADETKDVSKTEQLSVIVRFYLNGKVHERFLGFRPANLLDATSLLTYIKETLSKCSINMQNCIAQTYDGANVMKGSVSGVQTLFRKDVPQAIYTHCVNHRLNLVIVDVCRNIESANSFFSLLQKLYVFMSGSATHSLFINVQYEMRTSLIELKALSETRWICQAAACEAMKKTLPAIIVTLHRLAEDRGRGDRSQEAYGLLNSIDMEFLCHLCIFSALLKDIKMVSDVLQSKDCDIGTAYTFIESTIDRLKILRNSREDFRKIWLEALLLKEENGIQDNRRGRSRRLPEHLETYFMYSIVIKKNLS